MILIAAGVYGMPAFRPEVAHEVALYGGATTSRLDTTVHFGLLHAADSIKPRQNFVRTVAPRLNGHERARLAVLRDGCQCTCGLRAKGF